MEQFIEALLNPAAYEHEVDDFRVIETHISWVILTGEYAYKIKKPVKFGFLDFSTLENRKFFCEEELRLNTRLAPGIYLEVVTITGNQDKPVINGDGNVFEYAVKMAQFAKDSLLSDLADKQKLEIQHVNQIATTVANFHISLTGLDEKDSVGTSVETHKWVESNFTELKPCLSDENTLTLIEKNKDWVNREFLRIDKLIDQRKTGGFVRECHGDMHLGNMTMIGKKVIIFDGIEFNRSLRWIDVMNEIAFFIMDLEKRQLQDLSNIFLNAYLTITGDYSGLVVLNYYKHYRAMVRAKATALRLKQLNTNSNTQKALLEEASAYIQLADDYTKKAETILLITNGFSGSGKSTIASQIGQYINAIHIRSDVERKRIHHLELLSSTDSAIETGIYNQQSSIDTYKRLGLLAREILSAGYSVIVDACFLNKQQRTPFYTLAKELDVPFHILSFEASTDELKHRIEKRGNECNDPSEADISVLQYQLSHFDPIDDFEHKHTISIDTEEELQIQQIVSMIKSPYHSTSS